jgi:hypothetical protein
MATRTTSPPTVGRQHEKAETYKATQGANSGYSSLVASAVNWDLDDGGSNFVFLSQGDDAGVDLQPELPTGVH